MAAKQTFKAQQEKVKEKSENTFFTNGNFVFNKNNYLLMILGLAIVFIGFALMAGGETSDPNVFPKDEIYSFRRIVLAPIVILTGFGIELFAIFYKR